MSTVSVRSLAQATCAVVLAGGKGSRMGGVDKGLQTFKGQTLVQQALQRLRNQTSGEPAWIGINANRHLDRYEAMGVPVWPDATPDFAGPLAGFLAALQTCQSQGQKMGYVLTVPCDSPLFPLDLLERLAMALVSSQAELAMVTSPECDETGRHVMRRQPVFCLMKTHLLPELQQFVADGGSKIYAWAKPLGCIDVPFDRPGDAANAFANANTLAQLQELEQP